MPNQCVPEALTVEGVEQGVSGPVGDAAAPVRLAALTVLVRLPSEGALQEVSLRLMESTYCIKSICNVKFFSKSGTYLT